MARTYEPIASTTLGSAAADITFSSIPGTYTDLVLVCAFKTSRSSGTSESMYLRLNGDTGSNYSATALRGEGTAASSYRESSATYIYLGEGPLTSRSGDAVFEVSVMSYANTSVYSTVLSSFAEPASYLGRHVGLWRNTAAVTSVAFMPSTGGVNLKSGSTFALYGIKAA